MKPYGKDAGVFAPNLSLSASRLFAGGLCVLLLAAACAAGVSNLPLPLRGFLLLLIAALLLHTWRDETRSGLRRLAIDDQDENTFVLHFADGSALHTRYAGYSLLGTVAVFLHFERRGWRRIFGPLRVTVMRDAVDSGAFRRLRAWVRLA
jgi:hypothetical protein